MRRFFISEMDENARLYALKLGVGVEVIAFCSPENMENEGFIRAQEERFADIADKSLHAPYYELFPCAIDPLIRNVAKHRFTQALETCSRLNIRRMIVHSGYAPQMYFPQWFVPKSIAFWKEFCKKLPEDFELMIENVLDVSPEYIAQVCDGIGDSRVRICLDVGHANAYSSVPPEKWIEMLGSRIAHVHLHNNSGAADEHAALNCGNVDIQQILDKLDEYAPDAAICIESLDAAACLRWLMKRNYINDEPV